MTEHPNVQRMREGYDAFAKGDLAAFDDLWDDDVRWHNSGHSQVSGTFEGRPAIFEMFGRLFEITEGSLRLEVLSTLADDAWGFAAVHVSGRRGDRTLDVMDVHTVRLTNGRVVEFWQTSTEPDLSDAFYG
jgi:ketosteroid isomerase-like protein